MKTLKELNEKVWYRFLKVVYILFYLPYFLLLFLVIFNEGRDYHYKNLPDSVEEVIKDPEFYKLEHIEKYEVLSSIDVRNVSYFDNFAGIGNRYLSPKEIESIIEKLNTQPIPTTPLQKKFIYKSYWTWNITKCIGYSIILTICYISFMECVRRGFYYILNP